jgi:hypothetical protein
MIFFSLYFCFSEDSSPRRDNNNRKWVRSMTRRIRDFMYSANNVDPSN